MSGTTITFKCNNKVNFQFHWYPPHALEMWGAEIPKRPTSRVLSVTPQIVLDRPIGRPVERIGHQWIAIREEGERLRLD